MRLTRFAGLPKALALSLLLASCENSADAVTASAGEITLGPATAAADTTTNCAAATANPARVVCLANAFKATLSTTQQSAVQLGLTQTLAVRWSNLPCGSACRNGVQFSTLTAEQLTAALAVAQAALSEAGYGTFDGIRKADTFLALQGSSGGPGGGYGEGIYLIAFLGAPSTTAPWILQLGGHHYALNLAYNGSAVPSPTPHHVAVEPGAFTLNGVAYAPLSTRRDAMYAMLNSLDATQLAAARLSASYDDVLLGPNRDGQFPSTQSGVLVSSLSASQQALVRAAIEAWVMDVPADEAADILSSYESAASLARTYVAWSGSTDSTVRGSYIRIDGPRVWIEMAAQGGVVFRNQIHYHTIWRDKAKDYGANFSAFVRTDTVTTGADTAATNAPPAIASLRTDPASGPFSIAAKSCGGLYTACLRFQVTDVNGSTDAPFRVAINWGDGMAWTPNSVPASTPLVAPHSYAAAGSYPVSVTVTDARGAATTQALTLQVTQ